MPTEAPLLAGLDHIKLASSNIVTTSAFYVDILGFTRIPEFDHRTPSGDLFAVICKHPSIPTMLEIRLNAEQATRHQTWDPVTWSVETRADLEKWATWLALKDVKCSKVLTALRSWVLVAEDPDGRFVRFMTKETHEWTTETSKDAYWLR
ncbi:hypothetical protein B0A48_04188 [Cryoendolithus antarcticus]|uniref:VOC domain-containing protein n=1 Tax=Cryoendolithus antarcticus TaxID=1507870 RepID=A0A1V8TEP4_9PEZI|nr:hypothetical protein B0A48_04188 [Cryoendolithus antarcticus]